MPRSLRSMSHPLSFHPSQPRHDRPRPRREATTSPTPTPFYGDAPTYTPLPSPGALPTLPAVPTLSASPVSPIPIPAAGPPPFTDEPEELPPYSPHPSSPPPLPRRAQNIRSALRLLRLQPGVHKPAALARHLALFEKLVARLAAEGVVLSPAERGWALVMSCPGLALLDVWYNICEASPEGGEDAWTALLAAYTHAGYAPEAPRHAKGHMDRTLNSWLSLLGR